MEIVVDFPGGAKVAAHLGSFTVQTDQPPSGGGESSAPSPYSLFLTALATCAGFYVLDFCRHREIPTAGMKLIQQSENDPATGLTARVVIEIQLPAGFPEKYKSAVIRAAEQCKVKKQLDHPPAFQVSTIGG